MVGGRVDQTPPVPVEPDDAAYTLCVLTGQCGAHAAVLAAGLHLAAHGRLPQVPATRS